MTIRTASILLAALLLAIPAADAAAQSKAADTSLSPGPANASDVPVATGKSTPSSDNPRVPGATGETIVKGDNSTVALDRAATAEQRTGNK